MVAVLDKQTETVDFSCKVEQTLCDSPSDKSAECYLITHRYLLKREICRQYLTCNTAPVEKHILLQCPKYDNIQV